MNGMDQIGERLLRLWIRVPRFVKRMVPLSLTLYVLLFIVTNGITTLLHFNIELFSWRDLIISLAGAAILVPVFNQSKGEDKT
ncbi:hypothetical protein Exig_1537 [Exiguobacterium sibiricum 255-15]|uniref:Uncharacterized protein n=2 Tax=Bacillales Family XII. Incertae Sedis TaxID=539742 RepID=B1YGJ0_EXIS2|nr:hypothetical protein Exig_1537 [Exiguobacterium sibiricum 255-15]